MIYEKAHAKINLTLDVSAKRDDGYHDLKMIMIPIDLHDTLSFEKSKDVKLTSNIEIKDNVILKTLHYMKQKYRVEAGALIHLTKHIPLGAGLGGGSADIAATIRGLNRLWALNLSQKELEEIALNLGSDTLFCLYEKPAYVYGRGEHIEFIQNPSIDNIYLFYPNIEVSTAYVFKNHVIQSSHHFDQILNYYKNESWDLFFNHTYNDLLETTLKCYPKLNETYAMLKKIDEHMFMSGSGSTFFLLNSRLNLSEILKNQEKMGVKIVKTTIKT